MPFRPPRHSARRVPCRSSTATTPNSSDLPEPADPRRSALRADRTAGNPGDGLRGPCRSRARCRRPRSWDRRSYPSQRRRPRRLLRRARLDGRDGSERGVPRFEGALQRSPPPRRSRTSSSGSEARGRVWPCNSKCGATHPASMWPSGSVDGRAHQVSRWGRTAASAMTDPRRAAALLTRRGSVWSGSTRAFQ